MILSGDNTGLDRVRSGDVQDQRLYLGLEKDDIVGDTYFFTATWDSLKLRCPASKECHVIY